MSELNPPTPVVKNNNKRNYILIGVVFVAVVIGAFFLGSSSGNDTPATTTTTLPENLLKMEEVVADCDAQPYFDDDQIVFSLDEYSSYTAIRAMDCVANKLMSPATYGQFGATSAMSGLQEASEDGYVFKFSYNGVNGVSFLSVELDD